MEAAWLRDQRLRDSCNKGNFMMKGIDWEVAAAQQKQLDKIAAQNKAKQNRQTRLSGATSFVQHLGCTTP